MITTKVIARPMTPSTVTIWTSLTHSDSLWRDYIPDGLYYKVAVIHFWTRSDPESDTLADIVADVVDTLLTIGDTLMRIINTNFINNVEIRASGAGVPTRLLMMCMVTVSAGIINNCYCCPVIPAPAGLGRHN